MAKTNILYVEDDHDNRNAISELFPVIFDCTLDTAENGLEGVEKALTNEYSVIIMDVGLPDINGIEAARRIKAQKPKQVIVCSSGHACLPEDTPAGTFDGNFCKPLAAKLKEFQMFCVSIGVDLVELQ